MAKKQRVVAVERLTGALLLAKHRFALRLKCGHTVPRRTNVRCVNTRGYRVAYCEYCRAEETGTDLGWPSVVG